MKKFVLNRFLLILSTVIVLFLSGCGAPGIPPIQGGQADLSHWDRVKTPILALNGEWEVYWNHLYTPADFKQGSVAQPIVVRFPSMFASPQDKAQGLSGQGYATFHLHLTGLDTNQQWGLMVPNHSTTYDLWVNGQFFSGGGRVATNKAGYYPKVRPQLVFFQATSPTVDIVVQWANFDYKYGGMVEKYLLGTASDITRYQQRQLGVDLILIGILFIMGIYHLAMFLFRRREPSSLYFAILCTVIALRSGLVGQYFFSQLFPSIDWYVQTRLAYILSYLMLPALTGFLAHLYPQEIHPKLARVIILAHIPMVLIPVILPATIYSQTLLPYQILAVLSVIYLAWCLIQAIRHHREGAQILVVVFLLFMATVINDILVSNGVLFTPQLMALGFVIMIFGQSLVLLRRLTHAFEDTEIGSLDLEIEVYKRTQELEAERNKLRAQNDQMLNELAIARKIQSQIIPSSGPDNIAFFYRSMELVGGDFFDFLSLSGGKLGLFISDVSGHGVPAAFITTMIKSYSMQFSGIIDNPAEFLHFLNMTLFDQSGGNFVTAFYGIYDPVTRELHYANAGHTIPYVITAQGIQHLARGKGNMPLLILKNHEMQDNGIMYQNHQITLEPGSKLFLYTDGLTEAVRISDQARQERQEVVDFESARLMDILRWGQDHKPLDLVHEMQIQLNDFRGTDQFEDDVCFIVMEAR